ncbi:MAG: subclass B1 metallo-beta-lactamase [Saprospiraceae bacterium]
MKAISSALLLVALSVTNFNCGFKTQSAFRSEEVYKSDNLVVTRVSANTFVHTSYKQTHDFGNVPCNGLVVRNDHETIVFDTPTNDSSSAELIKWIRETLHCDINAIIPTHFHDDCLGGLKAFHDNHIPSYACFKTIELAKENRFVVPQNSFTDSLVLKVGHENIIAKFLGEGHTRDNIVGYFPSENVLFGGCLIKESGASKGFLGDANVADWSGTVERVKKAFPAVKIVVPGHGACGDKKLLDYTINLFQPQ